MVTEMGLCFTYCFMPSFFIYCIINRFFISRHISTRVGRTAQNSIIFIFSNVEVYNPLLKYKVCYSTGTHIPEIL